CHVWRSGCYTAPTRRIAHTRADATPQEVRPMTSPPPPQSPRNWPSVGRIMAYTAGALFVFFLANLLLRVLDLILLLLIGILLATAIDPAARRLRRIGLNRPTSILSVYLLIA